MDTIERWSSAAAAYRSLTRSTPIFTRLAERLVGALPAGFAGTCIDLAAGSGLLAELLLARHPGARVHLVEPAGPMLALAREALGARAAGYHRRAAEELGRLELQADACLASAAAHLLREEDVFPAVARALRPGGLYAFNLWGHSFETTADDPSFEWRAPVEAACRELGLAAPRWPAVEPPRVRRLRDLEQLGQACGLALEDCRTDRDALPGSFYVRFAAMFPAWMEHVPGGRREELLERARERCEAAGAPLESRSTRLLFRRSDRAPDSQPHARGPQGAPTA